jgi:hypothetical protein
VIADSLPAGGPGLCSPWRRADLHTVAGSNRVSAARSTATSSIHLSRRNTTFRNLVGHVLLGMCWPVSASTSLSPFGKRDASIFRNWMELMLMGQSEAEPPQDMTALLRVFSERGRG